MQHHLSSELYSIKYADKHAAAMVFRCLLENAKDLGLTSVGLESFKAKNNRTAFKIIIALPKELSSRIPAILSSVKETMREHPLFPHLSFDFHIIPITNQVNWNFDSYDDPNYQRIFIRKRQD